MEIINSVILVLLFNIFMSAGLSKIINLDEFKKAIKNFINIKNNVFVELLSILIIFTEIFFSILLLSNKFLVLSSIILLFLLSLFNLLIYLNLRKRRNFFCNCGGLLGNKKISNKLLIRNLFLSILIVLLMFNNNHNFDLHMFFIYEFVFVLAYFIYINIKEVRGLNSIVNKDLGD